MIFKIEVCQFNAMVFRLQTLLVRQRTASASCASFRIASHSTRDQKELHPVAKNAEHLARYEVMEPGFEIERESDCSESQQEEEAR